MKMGGSFEGAGKVYDTTLILEVATECTPDEYC